MKNAGEGEEKSMNMYIVKMIVKRFISEILGKICVSKLRCNNIKSYSITKYCETNFRM